jgi:hypothetical protein
MEKTARQVPEGLAQKFWKNGIKVAEKGSEAGTAFIKTGEKALYNERFLAEIAHHSDSGAYALPAGLGRGRLYFEYQQFWFGS